MSEQQGANAAGNAAGASSTNSANKPDGPPASTAAPKTPASQGNPAFRMMGLPRLRLPSRNWLIFLSITGSFAGAVVYDKWQTRRVKDKWCKVVSHVAEEPLSFKMMPRKMTVYLAAPPADGLRSAREHFHNYVKPVLVAAAMDWDVVEGRKEGDVRFKTAERIRRKRKRIGEGEPDAEEEENSQLSIQSIREKNGTADYDGIAGDLVVGRHTWKEYVRGLHEGWLGPADAPPQPETESPSELEGSAYSPGHSSLGDAAVKVAADTTAPEPSGEIQPSSDAQPSEATANEASSTEKKVDEEKKDEEEKPKRRNPLPYIDPQDYQEADISRSTPEILGPCTAIQFPHLLGFRNTPIRLYRFLTRRRLADDVGRQVAATVLASHRPFSSVSVREEDSASGTERTVPEQDQVLIHEEGDWWKTVRQPRKEHEESVWIEDMVYDERIASRMRKFQLTAEDEDRAKRIANNTEKTVAHMEES